MLSDKAEWCVLSEVLSHIAASQQGQERYNQMQKEIDLEFYLLALTLTAGSIAWCRSDRNVLDLVAPSSGLS